MPRTTSMNEPRRSDWSTLNTERTGASAASMVATMPPSEWPMTRGGAMPSARTKPAVACPSENAEYAGSADDAPWPGRSSRSTRWVAASAGTKPSQVR